MQKLKCFILMVKKEGQIIKKILNVSLHKKGATVLSRAAALKLMPLDLFTHAALSLTAA